ncbi:hypothetical protein [cf. Phormidesmis sp. LEGE 11477]|uniref:hypothetical protein n=1 Tax=cf. Phormidesmis sp. LEGE 11477 TaxID=1828680 RepID=UPI00187F067C|nr:hypothetical protein [cf. Phormidesmis sp. LEGE 11477]MBE9060431.1 hypothetical protein [cf. Phormidesmis sp. LEGE 11477]
MKLFPTPPTKSFERLHITDGLLITPEHWESSHAYHRRRQNFQFQSLYQPGIVCGLGVSILSTPPDEIAARDRDGRWVEIKPGIAFDAAGNPIVLTEPFSYQIKSIPSAEQKTVLIYLVANYVDPDNLNYPPDQETLTETFRIREKTTIEDSDVELCRIVLTEKVSGSVPSLSLTTHFHQPDPNTLDHRYRLAVRPRPHKTLRAAHITNDSPKDQAVCKGLNHLLQSTDALYPTLQSEEIQSLPLEHLTKEEAKEELTAYSLVVCPYAYIDSLAQAAGTLRQYLNAGGVLCFCMDVLETNLKDLHAIRQELFAALSELEADSKETQKTALLSEIDAIDREISLTIQTDQKGIFNLAAQTNFSIEGTGELGNSHPLLTQPFLFSNPPTVQQQPSYVFCWGGIVLIISDLINAWQLDPQLFLPRPNIRSTQEWGINLYHFAWQRRHLAALQRPLAHPPNDYQSAHKNTHIMPRRTDERS